MNTVLFVNTTIGFSENLYLVDFIFRLYLLDYCVRLLLNDW